MEELKKKATHDEEVEVAAAVEHDEEEKVDLKMLQQSPEAI
jgi:hypothetical protein